DILSTEKIIQLTMAHPDAKLIAHPECRAQVLELASFVGSTNEMIRFTRTDSSEKFIVATESGIIHQMKKESPGKEFIIVPSDESCACNDCPYMKMNTMEKIYRCLADESPEVQLDEDTIVRASVPILRMLELSKPGR
ncbi:MAG TPA: quinolinate synthase NadA, partial [Bacteroidales bacterium]|nr:quinolinate synthase NadA [Bacteroidales bacterium]